MPTKDELIAFASDVGVDVSSSATKAEIEAALYDAGYDPMTLEADTMADPETTDTNPNDPIEAWADALTNTSSDAAYSTYTEAAVDTDVTPPPGRVVEQTRGEPSGT